jgi:hypothetical protein
MINRKEFAQEIQLRKHIQEAIKVVYQRRTIRERDELQLRTAIRQLINEADPAVAGDAVHSNTGINALEDLFKNTNLLSVLRQGYKSLTSKDEQRQSYKNHILNAVDSSLEVESSRKVPDQVAGGIQEDIDINVGDRPEDNPAFIDVEKREPTEEEEVEGFSLAGHDKTGRNRAYTDYKNVEKNIIAAYDDLDDPQDRNMFKDYLLTNLKLYFERFEEELQTDLPAPDIEMPPEAAVAPAPGPPPEAGPPLGLQERVNLDMDEVVEWLLSSATK